MDRTEALEKLRDLKKIIEDYYSAKEVYDHEQELLYTLKEHYPSRLKEFDKNHFRSFIENELGPEPIKPKKELRILPPVYYQKIRKYNVEVENYKKMFHLAEAAYRDRFANERNAIIEQDKIEKQKAIDEKNDEVVRAEQAFDTARAAYENDDLLGKELKTIPVIEKLIRYFEDKRVDTLKEAVNLFYDEKRKDEEQAREEEHRKQMRELEEERVRAAQSAEDYARMQYDEACNAAEYSRRAVEIAEEMQNQQKYQDI